MNERMERIETFADIGEFIDRPVKTYSKGMFARLSFSVYANLDPEVFIVDEALAVGDARFRHKCMYRFKQMQDQGVAVIYVSHDAASMKHLCDRVAWINNGRLEQIGESTPVVDSYLYHLFYDAPPTPIPSKEKKPVRGDDAKGSLAGTFTHCELLDEDSHFIEHATGGQKCAVRLTFKNHHIAANDDKLIIGFVINSVQGLAITGANTIANDVAIERPRPGESVVVTFRFTMPPLVPGSYAVEVTGVNLDEKGTLHLLHMLPNAMMFQTSHPKQIFGLIGLDCEISVESDDA
jgi:lipopolysaccharide transport system ATP-binding protein